MFIVNSTFLYSNLIHRRWSTAHRQTKTLAVVNNYRIPRTTKPIKLSLSISREISSLIEPSAHRQIWSMMKWSTTGLEMSRSRWNTDCFTLVSIICSWKALKFHWLVIDWSISSFSWMMTYWIQWILYYIYCLDILVSQYSKIMQLPSHCLVNGVNDWSLSSHCPLILKLGTSLMGNFFWAQAQASSFFPAASASKRKDGDFFSEPQNQ